MSIKLNVLQIVLFAIIIGSLLGLVLHIYKPWQLIGKKSSTVEIGKIKNRILIPIEINGIICNFVWDTGADSTMVSKSIMTKCNIESSGQEVIGIMYTNKTESQFEVSKPVLLKIGDFEINSNVVISPNSLRFDFDMVTIDGILGQDIISKYYWLFDLDTNTAIISNREIPQSTEPDFILTLFKDFHSDPSVNRKPVAGVRFNDILQPSFFDSGMSGKALFAPESNEENYISSDILIAMPDSSNLDFLDQFTRSLGQSMIRITGSNNENETPKLLHIIAPNLELNDLNPAVFFISTEVDNYHKIPLIYLTANFMRRFGRMYYDPHDRKVEFYKSSRIDTKRFSGEYILDFLKQNFGNEFLEDINKLVPWK